MTDPDHPGDDPEAPHHETVRPCVWPRPKNEDEKRALVRRLNELTQLGLLEHDRSEFCETGRVTVRYKLPMLNALPFLNLLPSAEKTK